MTRVEMIALKLAAFQETDGKLEGESVFKTKLTDEHGTLSPLMTVEYEWTAHKEGNAPFVQFKLDGVYIVSVKQAGQLKSIMKENEKTGDREKHFYRKLLPITKDLSQKQMERLEFEATQHFVDKVVPDELKGTGKKKYAKDEDRENAVYDLNKEAEGWLAQLLRHYEHEVREAVAKANTSYAAQLKEKREKLVKHLTLLKGKNETDADMSELADEIIRDATTGVMYDHLASASDVLFSGAHEYAAFLRTKE